MLLRGLEGAWSAVGYLVGGIVVWGGVGMWLDGVLGWKPVLTIIGALVGNFAGVYLIYIRSFPPESPSTRRNKP
jgi:F0F1-type ATP synthase assembly protein I